MSDDEKVWDIVNMSDAYTIGGDLEAVRLAVLLLGSGSYGLNPFEETGAEGELPLLLFGGEKWIEENIGDLSERLDARKADVSEALRGVCIGGLAERKLLRGLDEEQRRAYHDEKRSSLNDIGARAWRLGARLAESPAEPATPAAEEARDA